MMVSLRLYWTLWMLSCFGQYLGQDLQIPEPPVKAEGESVVLTPDNPPDNPSILITQWHFTSTLIATAVSGVVTVSPSYEGRVSLEPLTLALTLQNLKLSDSGTYRLTVTPTDGGALTGETSLQVIVNYVRLIGPEESLIEGESSANITSEGTGSMISVEWMKDNKPLSPSNSIIFSPDNKSVSISPVQRSDSGEYQCTYRNPVSSETAKLNLIINYGPAYVSIKGPDVVDLGVSVSLTCSANSEPSASFSWRFNGTDTSVTTNTFTRDETDFTHSGDYECIAWNSFLNTSVSQTHVLLVKVGGAGGGGGGGGGGLSTGAIVGIVIGVLVGVAAICGLIVYLIKTNKIPKLNKEQKGQASGASQSRQEPDSNYEEITDFQTTRGHGAVRASESTVYVNFNHKENEYENVKR